MNDPKDQVRHDRYLSLPQPFEEISHTADVTVRVGGETKEVTLARLVLALGHLLAGGGSVPVAEEGRVRAEAGDLPVIAVDVLRELLYQFATRGVIPAGARVEDFDGERGAEVVVQLGFYDEEMHRNGSDIKAVTFHQARFDDTEDGGWTAEVTFDI